MAQEVDIGNVKLYPGDFLDFEYLKIGNATQVGMAVHAIKAALADDKRWNYQGSVESATTVTITVQIRKDYPQTYGPMATGILPVVAAGYGVYILAGTVIALVSAALISYSYAAIQTQITARRGLDQIVAIWTNPDLTEGQKQQATAAINQTIEASKSAPLISTGGGLSMGLVFAGGAVLLFLFLSQRSGR